MTDVPRLYDEQIVDYNVLEDRREYDVDMLKTMYSLTDDEAQDLYYLIQRNFDQGLTVDVSKEPADRIKEYFVEAEHNDYEGWNGHDKVVMLKVVDDLRRWLKNYG